VVVHIVALQVDEEIRVVDRGCKQGEGKYGSMGKLDVEDSCNRDFVVADGGQGVYMGLASSRRTVRHHRSPMSTLPYRNSQISPKNQTSSLNLSTQKFTSLHRKSCSFSTNAVLEDN
jgi:hypothetical protein